MILTFASIGVPAKNEQMENEGLSSKDKKSRKVSISVRYFTSHTRNS